MFIIVRILIQSPETPPPSVLLKHVRIIDNVYMGEQTRVMSKPGLNECFFNLEATGNHYLLEDEFHCYQLVIVSLPLDNVMSNRILAHMHAHL